MPVLMPFVILPVLEVLVFILVSLAIGFWPALALLIVGSGLGIVLLRLRGAQALNRLRRGEAGGDPARAFEGLWQTAAGLLLAFPGFVTDAFALALVLPPVRRALGRLIFRLLATGMADKAQPAGGPAAAPPRQSPHGPAGPVIDVEFEDLTPPPAEGGKRL